MEKGQFIPIEEIGFENERKMIPGTGVVIGKFYPPHLGHSHLIEAALEKADVVTVIVVDRKGQEIPGKLRAQWIAENHPVFVKVIEDKYPEWDSKLWAKLTLDWLRYIPEFAFTSEDYGQAWAKNMGSTHVLVDRERIAVPISGTDIRNDFASNLQFLKPNVRAFFEQNPNISFSDKK